MIAGTTGGLRHNVEAELSDVEGIDEGIDHAHRIIGANRLVESLRKKYRLIAARPSMNRAMPSPRLHSRNHTMLRRLTVRGYGFSHGLIQKQT